MTSLALDTSAAVPYLMASHPAHRRVREELSHDELVLTAHSLAETYAVITRLPGDARVAAPDAATLLDDAFGTALVPDASSVTTLAARFASLGILGGAVHDGLVALAARDHGTVLVTRDLRAMSTYTAVGVEVRLVRG